MAASNSSNVPESTNQISDAEDTNMFQAARRLGRRNALPDLGEHLFQLNPTIASSDVDKIAPSLQSMSIKN